MKIGKYTKESEANKRLAELVGLTVLDVNSEFIDVVNSEGISFSVNYCRDLCYLDFLIDRDDVFKELNLIIERDGFDDITKWGLYSSFLGSKTHAIVVIAIEVLSRSDID